MTDLAEPTPERRRRSAFVVGSAVATELGPARAGSRIHRALSTLERLAKAGILEPRQAEAGERLRTDYELGVEGAREAAAGSASSVGWYYAEARLAALRRYDKARAVLGPTRIVVIPICLGRRQPFCRCELCRLDYGRLAYPRTLTREKAITLTAR